MNPRNAAKAAITHLVDHADEERAASFQRYFKEPVAYYGIEYADFKEWLKAFLTARKGEWTIVEAVDFCERMLKDPHDEARGMGFQVVGAFVDEAGPEHLDTVKRWLEDYCGNWGLVDNLAPTVLSPILRRHPDLAAQVTQWTASPNQWVRRGAAVSFINLLDDDRFADPAYDIATRLLDDPEDLIHKAVGWLLREAGKRDRDRLETYLLAQGQRLPRTTLRYAIEKFPKEDRKRLMKATR